MTQEERLRIKITNLEKIVLSHCNELIRLILIVSLVISLSIIAVVVYHFRISIISIAAGGLLLIAYWFFYRSIRNYVAASIKGEMLITKDIYNTNKVTSLKSIRSLSSITLFRINYTRITYKLDGVKYNIRILKKIDSNQLKNEEIIKTAMNIAC